MLVVAAMVAGVLVAVAAPANAATTPAAPGSAFVKCSNYGNGVYIKAGSALLHVSSWSDYGYGGGTASNSAGVAEPARPSLTAQTCKPSVKTPANGTFVRAVVADASQTNGWRWSGSVYEIIGGAPITVHSWSNIGIATAPKPVPVSASVLSSLASPGACPSSVAGCLYSRPASGTTFAGYSTAAKKATTFYKVDAAGHPFPQAAATSGEKNVDQTSINACERMNCSPLGTIITGSPSYGVLHVEGFAMDFPSAAPVSVQLVVDQAATYTLAANQQNVYQPASTAGSHGFAADLPIVAGVHAVCATIMGSAPGATTGDLGCSYPTVLGTTPGRVHRPKAKPLGGGRLKVKWKAPAANGNPINTYVVKCSGAKAKQAPGAKHSRILKHLPRGKRLTCKVRALSAGSSGGYGAWSKKSKPVTVR